MRMCFTVDEPKGLESVVSYHFGHAPYYVMVDVDGNRVTNVVSMENPMAGEHNPGDLPTFMKENGVNVIVSGGMGPRAQEYFASYGIRTVVGVYGKVKDVLEEYLNGNVEYALTASGEHHHYSDNEEIDRLVKEVKAIREQLAELKGVVKKLEEKVG
ncbi:MAG: NifB/NifX family molybdenum-iron cluster-binding protein [Synergistetes bacterium]|nr:NifB/NifX family molybdenum-iron cluster-binding protein [Synergistota bacterium]